MDNSINNLWRNVIDELNFRGERLQGLVDNLASLSIKQSVEGVTVWVDSNGFLTNLELSAKTAEMEALELSNLIIATYRSAVHEMISHRNELLKEL